MSRKVTKIPQARRYIPIENQRLRVAAYCRVSTRHEEQCHSLKAQIAYYTDYIERNSNWEFVAVYSDIASGVRTANHPRLPAAHERLCQREGRLDFGEVS